MLKVKKNLSVLLCLSVILSSLSTENIAIAAQSSTEEQINELFSELTKTISQSLTDDSPEHDAEITSIEEQLSSLGVRALSEAELNSFLSQSGTTSSRISQPPNTNTVKWYLHENTNYLYNSEYYDIQRLVAVGYNPGGTLVTGKDNEPFYTNAQKLANGATTAISIYVQKLIGLIPVVQWTPYELLFSNTPSNVFSTSYVTHRCVSSIIFTYVKKSSQSDDQYALSMFSNSLVIDIHAHGISVVNSQTYKYSKQDSINVMADNYGSIPAAIQAYHGTLGKYDYISKYTIYSYNQEYSKDVYVPNPLVGPSQIY